MAKWLPVLVCALSAFVLLTPASRAETTTEASGQVALVARAAAGCEPMHAVVNADGTRQVTSTECWPQSRVPRRTVKEDRNQAGRPTGRIVQEFDARGRAISRRAVSIDAAGKESGTLTRYTYDSRGGAVEATSPVGR
jgi:YD repeat-containing protein